MKKIDLTGQRFGRLVVIKEAPAQRSPSGISKTMWYCNCDCGTQMKAIPTNSLRHGKTVSCGCWNAEKCKLPKQYNRKESTYDLSGLYGVGITDNGDKFYFDIEDYDLIKGRSWHVHHDYITASGRMDIDGTSKEIYMHRLVMGNPPDEFIVDHINSGRKNDNRKCNLRIVNRTQNNINRVMSPLNKSGVTGVHYHNRKNRKGTWVATINVNKKHLKFECKTFEEAVAKRQELEEKYYGEYAYEMSQIKFLENDLNDYAENRERLKKEN